MILVMTVIGGTGNLFASVLGSAFYLLLADWLSTLWPRWLLLLGLVLIAVSLWMQRGLWGLGETLWSLVRGKRTRATDKTIEKLVVAASPSGGNGEQA